MINDESDESKFRIFIPSVRLLHIATMSPHLHADGTYKLVWRGFYILIVEATDFNEVFYPLGLTRCSNEANKILNWSLAVFNMVC